MNHLPSRCLFLFLLLAGLSARAEGPADLRYRYEPWQTFSLEVNYSAEGTIASASGPVPCQMEARILRDYQVQRTDPLLGYTLESRLDHGDFHLAIGDSTASMSVTPTSVRINGILLWEDRLGPAVSPLYLPLLNPPPVQLSPYGAMKETAGPVTQMIRDPKPDRKLTLIGSQAFSLLNSQQLFFPYFPERKVQPGEVWARQDSLGPLPGKSDTVTRRWLYSMPAEQPDTPGVAAIEVSAKLGFADVEGLLVEEILEPSEAPVPRTITRVRNQVDLDQLVLDLNGRILFSVEKGVPLEAKLTGTQSFQFTDRYLHDKVEERIPHESPEMRCTLEARFR